MSRADVITTALAALRLERAQLDQAIAALEKLATPGQPAPTTRAAATKAPPKPGPTGIPKVKPTVRVGKLAGRVAEIKKLWDAGLANDAIAAKVGCSAEAIRLMGKAHRWERPPAPAVTRLAPGTSRRVDDD